MTSRKVTFGELFGEAGDLATRHAGLLALVTVAITATFLGFDWLELRSDERNGTALLSNLSGVVIAIFVQYKVVERLLADRWKSGQAVGVRRYGSLFGSLFVSGLAIGAGLILFILPGVYFAGRWLTSTQQIVERQMSAMDSLRTSWEDSKASQWVFTAANLIGLLPTAVVVGLTLQPDAIVLPGGYWGANAFINGLAAIGNVVSWVIATAAYRLAVPVTGHLDTVFD